MRIQPLLPTAPVLGVGVTAPQLSVAVAVPNAASIVAAEGLHPRFALFAVEPVAVITGAVTSNVQLMVRDALEVFPHASLANHVLVCVRKHPLLPTAPVLGVGVTAPQLSVAVAVPKAASIVAADGLHPRSALFAVVPVAVITGAVTSNVQLIVRDALEVFPQPSVAVHVLVCVRKQPLLPTAPVLGVGVTAPQLSVAVAVPNAASMIAADGLHPRSALFAVDPVAVITGAVTSNVQVAVRDALEVFPQPSLAVHVLV